MICPNCKLVSPPEALKCDCGYDFATQSMGPPLLKEREHPWRLPTGKRPSLKKAAYLIVSASILLLASVIPGMADSLGPVLRIVGFGVWLVGSTTLASAKGWHWGWGFLGLTGVGALILAFLPDQTLSSGHRKKSTPAWEHSKSQVRPRHVWYFQRRRALRKIALVIFASLLALATLFPPWSYTYARPGMAVVQKPAPRRFLLSPPAPEIYTVYSGVTIDLKRLSIEVLSIALIGGTVYSLGRGSNRKENGA